MRIFPPGAWEKIGDGGPSFGSKKLPKTKIQKMAMEAPPGPGVREPNGNERGAEEGHPQASSNATDRGGGIPLVRTHEAGLVRTSGRENEDVDKVDKEEGDE